MQEQMTETQAANEAMHQLWMHKWIAAGAFGVWFAVALAKRGYFGPLIAKIPPRVLPWVALAVGILTTWSANVIAGKPREVIFSETITAGITMGLATIGGHELVIEGLFNGKEIPCAPWAKKKDPPPPDA